MTEELAIYAALIVSSPWDNAWVCWHKPADKARSVVLFDRVVVAVDREKNRV